MEKEILARHPNYKKEEDNNDDDDDSAKDKDDDDKKDPHRRKSWHVTVSPAADPGDIRETNGDELHPEEGSYIREADGDELHPHEEGHYIRVPSRDALHESRSTDDPSYVKIDDCQLSQVACYSFSYGNLNLIQCVIG